MKKQIVPSSNLKKLLLNTFLNNLDKRCLISSSKKITFKTLLSYISQIIEFLNKNKLNGEIIITQFDNRILTFVFYIAAIFSKITLCPLDPKLPKERVNKIKKTIKAKKIIKNLNLSEKKLYDLDLFNLDNHEFLITFSSGTSGKPKGIIHDTNNILGSSQSYSKLIKLNSKTRILHCLPEFYMAGIVNTFFSCLWSSSQIFVVDAFNKKSIFNIWNDINKYKINLIYLVPSIYSMISNFSPLNSADIVKKNKIKFYSTSNNLYPNIRKTFFKKFKTKIMSCYGITEMGGPLTNEINPSLKLDSSGKTIKGCKIKIKKIKNKNFVFIKSNFMSKNLIIEGKKTRINLDKKGFFNSQDTGFMKNNNIILTGREKDVLKKGGELINLKDIENTIIDCPFIKEIAAIAIEDELSDEKLHLFVEIETKNINKENINILLNVIQKKMYKTERPDKIVMLRKMPKTLSGKIIKKQLFKRNAKNKIREIIL